MNKTETLETGRLILRKVKLEDSHYAFLNCFSVPEVNKFLNWSTHETENKTKEFFKSIIERYKQEYEFAWVIEVKAIGQVIGLIEVVEQNSCHKRAEIGYQIGKDYWGMGYTTEAVKAVIKYLFSLNYERVQGVCHEKNIASERVLLKSGMFFEGLLASYGYSKKNNQPYNAKMYAIANQEGLCKRRLRNLINKKIDMQEECLSVQD